MKSTKDYLDEIKEKKGIKSDYALAKYLKTTKQTISRYRVEKNRIDDYMALKVAEALDINPLEVIAAANQERAKSAEEKAAWERILKSVAACIVGVFLLFSPPESTESNTSGIYIMRT